MYLETGSVGGALSRVSPGNLLRRRLDHSQLRTNLDAGLDLRDAGTFEPAG